MKIDLSLICCAIVLLAESVYAFDHVPCEVRNDCSTQGRLLELQDGATSSQVGEKNGNLRRLKSSKGPKSAKVPKKSAKAPKSHKSPSKGYYPPGHSSKTTDYGKGKGYYPPTEGKGKGYYPPPPEGKGKGYYPPPEGKGKGYYPPPEHSSKTGKGYYPPPPGKGKGYYPPPEGKGKGYYPPPGGKGKGYYPPPEGKGKGYYPPPQGKGKGYYPPPQGKGKGYYPPESSSKTPNYGKGKGYYPPGKGKGYVPNSSCQGIGIIFLKDELRAAYNRTGSAWSIIDVPIYNGEDGSQIGFYTERGRDCVGSGTFTFGNPSMPSEITIELTCVMIETNPITGGTGDYACATGYEEFAFQDAVQYATVLNVCGLPCSY